MPIILQLAIIEVEAVLSLPTSFLSRQKPCDPGKVMWSTWKLLKFFVSFNELAEFMYICVLIYAIFFFPSNICKFWIPGSIQGAIVCLNWKSYKVKKLIRMTWNEYRGQENKNECAKPIWTKTVVHLWQESQLHLDSLANVPTYHNAC